MISLFFTTLKFQESTYIHITKDFMPFNVYMCNIPEINNHRCKNIMVVLH